MKCHKVQSREMQCSPQISYPERRNRMLSQMDWWCWWQTTGSARRALYLALERGHVLCATINNHNTVQFLLEHISNVRDIIAKKY